VTDPNTSVPLNSAPEIQNRAPKAPGIIPKNAQTWIIVAIASIMILVIAFSSSGAPKVRPQAVSPSGQTPAPPNQRQIEQYRAMVDEEARKLAAERQRLELAKTDAVTAAANAQTAIPGESNPYQNPYESRPPQPVAAPMQSPEEIQRLTLEAERKKREFNSLFSSNLALTYRKEPSAGDTAGVTAPPPQPQYPLSSGILPNAVQSAPPKPADDRVGQSGRRADHGTSRKAQDDDPSLRQADGKNYLLFEGTVLETVLTNRLNGSFVGPVNAMVTTNVYSHDHQQLLIPQGSRVLGEVQKVNSLGQQRLAVSFHRLIMPDGYSLNLDQFHGLNQIGETGLRDQVNHHYLQIFGVSLAIGAIAGIEQAGANYGTNANGVDAYRQGVANSLSQSSLRILDRFLNILPTITIREGHRIKVYLTDDLTIPAYDRHRLAGDL
jgi:type IV secretory pathway VirB10-like protein